MKNFIPSYAFNWSDPSNIAGHKQSGDIDNPNNFENHKISSTDFSTELLYPISKIELYNFYQRYYDFILDNKNLFKQEYFDKYFKK